MNLCNSIDLFSCNVYSYLSRVFRYRLKMSEIGLTDIFIFQIVDFCYTYKISNVKIYATSWKVESKYGNDIDLFIKRPDGKYNRFVFQAKIMSYNGAYKDLKLKKKPNQWDKLLEHELKYKSKSFYLFFNGQQNFKPIKTNATRKDCIGSPSITELGLGIVETIYVKKIREGLPNPYGQVYMRDFFPNYMDSIRKLFCCPGGGNEYSDLFGYDYSNIYLGAPYKLVTFQEASDVDETEDLASDILSGQNQDIASVRIIIDYGDAK